MINELRTLEVFGYTPKDLLKFSNKKVIYNCDRCGKEKQIRKADYTSGSHKFCHPCGNKDGRNGFAINDWTGKNNGRYKTGYTLKKNYCKEPGCNKEVSCRSKYCVNHAFSGSRNLHWRGGISLLHKLIRASAIISKWKKEVYHKDFCVCKSCGSKNTKLDAHHIKPFHKIFNEFLLFYKELDPIIHKNKLLKLSQKWKEFGDISNGISLCENCHNKVHNKKH